MDDNIEDAPENGLACLSSPSREWGGVVGWLRVLRYL
jgi:hypothetical protein